MKTLCVHPSNELYGSDRSFAMAIAAILARWPDFAITVRIPAEGPLTRLPVFAKVNLDIRPMWVLRRGQIGRAITVDLWKNFLLLKDALAELNMSDVAYINSIIAFDFIVAARFARSKAIIHVREIPNGKELVLFRWLLIWSKAALIFNSDATKAAFKLPRHSRAFVVQNGFDDPGEPPIRQDHREGRLHLLTIGRINGWKGQETLVDAVALLSNDQRARIKVRIVGGVFEGRDKLLDLLIQRIEQNGLSDIVEVSPFENDPRNSYYNADVVVVPSRLPEPFGRVAIEAMAYSKAVVCSGHGGLVEIVKDSVTGRHFEPTNAEALKQVLEDLLSNPQLIYDYGRAGRQRYLENYTTEASDRNLTQTIATILGSR